MSRNQGLAVELTLRGRKSVILTARSSRCPRSLETRTEHGFPQNRHFGIAARALTNTLQSGSSQTNKSLDGLPGYSTAGRNSTFFAAIVTWVLFSIGLG